jgi:hypothetical protein
MTTNKKPKTIKIELTIEEALNVGIGMALAEYIDSERFDQATTIASQICKQLEEIMEAEKQ